MTNSQQFRFAGLHRRPLACNVQLETRANAETGDIVGYGAVFYREGDSGTEYRPWTDVRERIAATAFDSALARPDDVVGLFNHDPNYVLGRTTAGTMALTTDATGLMYRIRAAETGIYRDVSEHLRRRDVKGSSFAFQIIKESWQLMDDGETIIRTIEDVRLFDVGPVTYPAYEATSADVRWKSPDELRDRLDKFRQSGDKTRHWKLPFGDSEILRWKLRINERAEKLKLQR